MSLQAAFRKRLQKARRDPSGAYHPETTRVVGAPEKHTGDPPDRPGQGLPERRAGAYPPTRKVSQHKDKQGSTAHHGGAGQSEKPAYPAYEAQTGEKVPPTLRGLPSGKGVRRNEYMHTPSQMRGHRGKVRSDKNFKKIPADNPYAGGHRNVEAAVMKAVRLAGGK